MTEDTRDRTYDVAVVGMAGRFPGAPDLDHFWENLRDGVESIATLSDEELLEWGASPAALRRPEYVRRMGALAEPDHFDARFFGVSPKEARFMDPQHRVFLETAWEALEHAGYDPAVFPGRIGVYAGAGLNTYFLHSIRAEDPISMSTFQGLVAGDRDYLTTRVSYKLDLRGPSLSVNTACSTSLVAVHLACQSLLGHESDMALAGGVTITTPPRAGYLWEEGGILSPDGRCRAFDARGAGTVGGNGAGLVVLRRYLDALEAGDTVHAVIRGSALNNDGHHKVGYTAPGVDGQAQVISDALELGGVDPATVTYVEAHGTGTQLGDPIEVAALTRAFGARTDRRQYCALGSVKTNVGHLNTAAGVAGLIKTVLALRHRRIPPSLHFERPNPGIDFPSTPFFVNTELREWATEQGVPRRAGVSSFGFGGTNAHVVLEEAPEADTAAPARPVQLLTLSARTPAALEAASARLADALRRESAPPLPDVAYTTHVGRRAWEHRRSLVCRDAAGAAAALEGGVPAAASPAVRGEHPVAFLFPGQGSQHVAMAEEVYRVEPTFRATVDRCAGILRPHLGFDLREVLYPAAGGAEAAAERLAGTGVTQPALFVVEYSLARLWMEWGVKPDAMLGHSVGEYVAATLAGVFSLEDALAVVAARGRIMQALPAGAMLSVPLPEEAVAALLGRSLSLAAVNGASLCVVSGPAEEVDRLYDRLMDEGTLCRRLHTSHAFHSEMMRPALRPFLECMEGVRLRAPEIPFLSNVSGTWISAEEATDPRYWVRHLRQTVRFAAGVRELLAEPGRIAVEVGPGNTLATLVGREPYRTARQPVLASLPHPREGGDAPTHLLRALGEVWTAGGEVDWEGFHRHERRRRVPLPTYPFQRKRFWVDVPRPAAAAEPGPEEPPSTLRNRWVEVLD